MIVILNSTLLLPEYLCIPIDVLDLYSEAQVSHLLFRFDSTVAVLVSGVTMSLCGAKTLLNSLPSVLWILRFFTLVDGNRYFPGPCEHRALFSNPNRQFSPGLGYFLRLIHGSVQSQVFEEGLL